MIISQHNPERINASEPSRQDLQNSFVINDRVKLGLLTCQTFTNGHFHFLITVEPATSKVSLYCWFHNNEEVEMALREWLTG